MLKIYPYTMRNEARATTARFPGQFSAPAPDTRAPTDRELSQMASFGITPPDKLVKWQAEANAEAAERYKQSSLAGLTYQSAVQDAHEALTGITADLLGTTSRKSVKDMVTHNDRLRGLGILLIVLALVGLVVDYIMYPAAAPV